MIGVRPGGDVWTVAREEKKVMEGFGMDTTYVHAVQNAALVPDLIRENKSVQTH